MKTPATITTSFPHGIRAGDVVSLTGAYRPWWLRLWHWITRYKAPVFTVTSVSETTFDVGIIPTSPDIPHGDFDLRITR
jgi:hypothetical protein